jgi:ssDNA-binding Zn-finger/Zn-ribbon topoisomerase 1
MIIRSGRRGKFVACSGYPRCRKTMPLEKLEDAKAAAASGRPVAAADNTATGGEAAAQPAGAKSRRGTTRPATGTSAAPGQTEAGPPPGFAMTRTGKPVVEVMPEPGTLHCPACGSTMELKRSRFGPFFSCTNFPNCRFNANLRGEAKKQAEELLPAPARPKPIPTDIPCDECGQPMLLRAGRRGRFLGCSAYPKCKGTKELPPGFNVERAAEAVGAKSGD